MGVLLAILSKISAAKLGAQQARKSINTGFWTNSATISDEQGYLLSEIWCQGATLGTHSIQNAHPGQMGMKPCKGPSFNRCRPNGSPVMKGFKGSFNPISNS
jgi:hypothetical protein